MINIQVECNLKRGYSVGAYDEIINGEQWIRISEGCLNNCIYCGETKINGKDPKYYSIPGIRSNYVRILDMNLIYKPRALEIIKELGEIKFNNKVVRYELQCGIDYRYLTQEIATALKQSRFVRIRLAWDYGYDQAYKIYDCINILENAGYKRRTIQVFMLANHLISSREFLRKLQTLAFWNVQVADCWFDCEQKGKVKPIHWNETDIKLVSSMCSDHNVMCRFNGLEARKLKK